MESNKDVVASITALKVQVKPAAAAEITKKNRIEDTDESEEEEQRRR